VGVLGASGYAGRELCGIIAAHPRLELAFATANEQRGQRASFAGQDIVFQASETRSGKADLVFSALPHGTSSVWVDRARGEGAKVVDLSQDLRPGTGPNHVPYGLTELTRSEVAGADIVANPGCYPTAILIALAPLLAEKRIPEGASVTISAASGGTGAGYSPKPELLFAEVTENFRAYGVGNGHRHLVEMREMTRRLGGDVDILFTPHLLPVARGILATITVPVIEAGDTAAELWQAHYKGERFIRIAPEPPSLRSVTNTNSVALSVVKAEGMRQPTLIIIAAIDNLVKGAAGQAVQNANLMLGLDEASGLVA
jgi:N-acetyl-gamma-glutamyl-phosphate reductase, common form